MTLPCSGPISLGQIQNEVTGTYPLPLDDASLRDNSNEIGLIIPDSMSEFYCYETPPPFVIVLADENNNYKRTEDGGATWQNINNPGTISNAFMMQCAKNMLKVIGSNNSTLAKAASVSFDAGDTFVLPYTSATSQTAVCFSWDGTKYYYCAGSSAYYGSTSQNTTTRAVGNSQINSAATSNAEYVFIGHMNTTGIRRSTNYGATWLSGSGTNLANIQSVACGEQGRNVYAGGNGEFHKSTDFGANFTRQTTPFTSAGYLDVACSADGKYILVRATSKVWLSTDYAVSWTEITSSIGTIGGQHSYGSRNVSYDGKYMMVLTNNTIKASSDYGITWSTVSTTATSFVAGCIAESIVISNPPVAEFQASTTTPTVDSTYVNFSDQSSNYPDAWIWLFTPSTVTYRNGSTSTDQNPVVSFNVAGNYTVKLTASNSAGSDIEEKINYITATDPVASPLNADFSTSDYEVPIDTTINLSDLSTGSDPPNQWKWSIVALTGTGTVVYVGGTSSTSQNPEIQFTGVGNYAVTLEVWNAGGEYDSATDTSFYCSDLLSGNILYYKLDETLGTIVIDSSATNFPADRQGAVTNDNTGKINTAYYWPPGNVLANRILASGSSLYSPGTLVFSCWMNYNAPVSPDFGTHLSLLYKGGTGDDESEYLISYEPFGSGNRGLMIIRWDTAGSYNFHLYDTNLFQDGTWYHVVVEMSGDTFRFYLNNVLQTETSGGVSSSYQMYKGSGNLYVGSAANTPDIGSTFAFMGTLDEVSMWNRQLTEQEITLLYNSGSGRTHPFNY